MASRVLAGAQAAALAPAGLGLWLFVVVVEIRMDEPWSSGVLFLVAAVAAAALLVLALAAADDDEGSRPEATILVVGGLSLAAVAIGRFGDILGGDDFLDSGGTLTLLLALFTAVAAFYAQRTRLSICVLLAALAGVGLVLEFVNWVFGAEDFDTYRVLLAIIFVALFAAGALLPGRTGVMLVAAAGITVIASYYTFGLGLVFGVGENLGWGWELITLLQGVALAVYAATQLERGPGYLAFFVLLLFASTAAIVATGEDSFIFEGDEPVVDEPDVSLIGWPLVLLIGTIVAAAAGLRRQVAAKS
jgi:hypothetical protein